MDKLCIDKIYMDDYDTTFNCIVIKNPSSIKNLDWHNINYIDNIMNMDNFKEVPTNCNNFKEVLATELNINLFKFSNIQVKTEIIAEEPYYLYEMLYVDLNDQKDYHKDENEIASLINVNGDKIYSNAIIFKNHLPALSDKMNLVNITKDDLHRVLSERVNTKIVIYDDDEWKEKKVIGNLETFANSFFEGEKYKKLEIAFLMHNINIWYLESVYGNSVCGNILKKPIEKCIWFTMKSDDYRGNLSLDEVNKIINISKKVSNYNVPSELLVEKLDNIGRKIVNNKYKVLDWVYYK
jgi:hypothetical protein